MHLHHYDRFWGISPNVSNHWSRLWCRPQPLYQLALHANPNHLNRRGFTTILTDTSLLPTTVSHPILLFSSLKQRSAVATSYQDVIPFKPYSYTFLLIDTLFSDFQSICMNRIVKIFEFRWSHKLINPRPPLKTWKHFG